jgi:hypothetical protein
MSFDHEHRQITPTKSLEQIFLRWRGDVNLRPRRSVHQGPEEVVRRKADDRHEYAQLRALGAPRKIEGQEICDHDLAGPVCCSRGRGGRHICFCNIPHIPFSDRRKSIFGIRRLHPSANNAGRGASAAQTLHGGTRGWTRWHPNSACRVLSKLAFILTEEY